MEEVHSLELLGLTISRDLSWAAHAGPAKLASTVSRRRGVLNFHFNHFLWRLGPLADYKAFLHNSVEYCSPLVAGAPWSHPSLLYSMECKALTIIGISHNKAKAQGELLLHHRLVSCFCFFRLFHGPNPFVISALRSFPALLGCMPPFMDINWLNSQNIGMPSFSNINLGVFLLMRVNVVPGNILHTMCQACWSFFLTHAN